MLQLGSWTCKLRVPMAGTLITRAVLCRPPASAAPIPPHVCQFASTKNTSLGFFRNRERFFLRWQVRGLQSVLLRPTACVDVQPPNSKAVKARRTRATKSTETLLVVATSTPTESLKPFVKTLSHLVATESSDESSDLEGSLDVAGSSSDLDVDESALESETLGIINPGDEVTEIPTNVCIVGIDPDASGAIAVLKSANQDIQAEVLDVPCVKVQVGKTMRRRHDARSIVDLMNQINAPEGSIAYVEQATPFPKDGKQGWYGTGFGYGMWVGILMASGYKVVPVRAQAWKSAMGIAGKQYTKDDSRNLAMSLFPDLAPQLKRKKDHGRADALLIAAFGKGMPPTTIPSQ